jgi:methyl-accepting chemotaxis protein
MQQAMKPEDSTRTIRVRLEAFASVAGGTLSAGAAAIAVHQASGSWLASLFAVQVLAGLVGAWVDLRVRQRLGALDAIGTAANDFGDGQEARRVDEEALGLLGSAGVAFNAMLDGLEITSARVLARMRRVRDLPERISGVLGDIQTSADSREEAVEETASLLANINSSMGLIATRVEDLSTAADESSSSILEMGSSVEEVARNTASLHESFEVSSSAVHQMSASIRQVAESADLLRQMAEESSVSMNAMDLSIQEVGGHVQEASSLTQTVNGEAKEGGDAVAATIQDIEQINSLIQDAKGGLGKLVSRLGEISTIMSSIGDINDETNLLSLNAAIIAAQAGEQGKAFLVVANHVKTLATRTAIATRDVEQLLSAVQSESDAAVKSMENGVGAIEQGVSRSRTAGRALSAIQRSSGEASSRVADIARVSEQQTRNSKMITHSVQETSVQIQQISEAMAEQASVSERMLETSQSALSMCQHVHRSTNEQRETGRYISSSVSSITEMIQGIHVSIAEHRTASESVSEAVFRLLDNSRTSAEHIPELNTMLSELRDSAEEIVGELQRFEKAQ